MKKMMFLASLLLSAVLFMNSCGEVISSAELEREKEKEEEEDDREKASTERSDPIEIEPEEIEPVETEAFETVPAQTTAPVASSVEYAPGDIGANGTYTSKWLGLKFTPSASMVMSTSEELAAMADPTSSQMVYEMMAVDSFTGSNVNIIVEKLPMSAMTEEQYLAFGKLQYQELGFELQNVNEYDTEFFGEQYRVLEYYVEYSGVSITNAQFVRKIGDRMVVITMCAADGNMEKLISCFSDC